MRLKQKTKKHVNIIEYPIITDKTTKNIEDCVYYFRVSTSSKKDEIKKAIEKIFDVKVQRVNTSICASKAVTMGKLKGRTKKYKKAIIKLKDGYSINLFKDN